MIASHEVWLNGIRHHYLELGTEGMPTLVCLHGLTRNARDFLPLAQPLGNRFHLYALDVRGRGDSDRGPADRYVFPQYVEDLKAALDAWGIARTSLLGTSMGGIISLLFAARYPERVERLILNDVGPEVDPRGVARILATTTHAPEEFADREGLIAYFRTYFPPAEDWPAEKVWAFAQSSFRATVRGTWVWKMDPVVRQALLRGGASAAAPDLWAELKKLRCPLLIIRGAKSDVLSPETCARIRQLHPETRLVEVPGVGHPPLLTEAPVTEALPSFLSSGAAGHG